MTGTCALCGCSGLVDQHHLTGRPAPGRRYSDPALVVPLCSSCHRGAGGLHPILRCAGLDLLPPGADLLAHRLRRVAMTAELVAGAARPFTLAPPATRGLGQLLRDAAEVVEGVGR